MKTGDTVTNRISIENLRGERYDPNTLIGVIYGIGRCMNCTCNGDYLVNSYDVNWGPFKSWHIGRSLKKLKKGGDDGKD